MAEKADNPYVKWGKWQGETAVYFGAGGYEAVLLPETGGNLVCLKNDALNVDILRWPSDMEVFRGRPQVYGIPVLFPPNRIEKGTFTRAGRTYHFPVNEPGGKNNHIHGILRTKKWDVTKAEADENGTVVEICFSAGPDADFYSFFPHSFVFKIHYTLSSTGLGQKISISNTGSEPMPMGLGFHTAFRVPFHAMGNADACRLKVTVGEQWELDENILPTGKLTPVDGEISQKGIKPQGEPFMDHYRSKPMKLGDRLFNGAILEDSSVGMRLVYEVGNSFMHWALWNEDGRGGFVCPEPQTWAINAPNINLPDEITGFRFLEPGEIYEDYCSIKVEDIK